MTGLQASIKALQTQVESLQQEMKTDINKDLSPSDQRDKERLTREVEALKKELAALTDRRVEVGICERRRRFGGHGEGEVRRLTDRSPQTAWRPRDGSVDRGRQAEKQRNELQSELTLHLQQRQADLKRHLEELSRQESADKVPEMQRRLADAERSLAESSATMQRTSSQKRAPAITQRVQRY